MATFTNQATLSYNGRNTNSNIVTGTIQEILSANKTASTQTYSRGDEITYFINIINSGAAPLTGVTVRDNLGEYNLTAGTAVPLTYVSGSVALFINGVPSTAPTVTAGPPLVFSGITIPGNSNATIVYRATVNEYAPLGASNTIVNIAEIRRSGVEAPLTVTETIGTLDESNLVISKSLSPNVVEQNGTLTYTFTIQNFGNSVLPLGTDALITDTFNPIINPITVTFNGNTWTLNDQYTYNTTTGEFATVAGRIGVPAATYTVDPVTGLWTVIPGVSTITVTGTI